MNLHIRLRFIISNDIFINRFITATFMAKPELNNVVLDFYSALPGEFIIDCPRWLSVINRKSYRSGYVYSIDYIEYIGSAEDTVRIAKLPESYGTLQAYNLGFEAWKSQRADALEEADGTLRPGKWSDFKPYFDITHMNGTRTEMSGRACNAGSTTLGELDNTGTEWARATIQVNDTAAATTSTLSIGMLGDDDLVTSYASCFDAMGDTRGATLAPDPLIPIVASASWVNKTGESSEEMSTDVILAIMNDNDFPPYANQADTTLPPTYVGNGQSAPGGVLVDTIVTGTTGRSVSMQGGLFPLGLMAVSIGGVGVSHQLRIHMTRGEYKGVAALPMGDFR
jgi:hypothetical protein